MKTHLAPALIVVGTLLAAANWVLEPGRAVAWALALLLFGVMTAAMFLVRRRSGNAGRARDSIDGGLMFAALIMVISLGMKLAVTLGLVHDAEFPGRATNVILGVLLLSMGNDMPKQLVPLSARHCSGAQAHAMRRFAGWTWVIAGSGYAIAWLALPLEVAKPLSLVLVVSAMLVTAGPLLWGALRRA